MAQPGMREASIGQHMTPGDSSSASVGPAVSPEEEEGRKSMWMQALQDPAFLRMAFTMGTSMMQGQRPGESSIGAVGRGLQSAVGTEAAHQAGRKKTELEERRIAQAEGATAQRAAEGEAARKQRAELAEAERTHRETLARERELGEESRLTKRLASAEKVARERNVPDPSELAATLYENAVNAEGFGGPPAKDPMFYLQLAKGFTGSGEFPQVEGAIPVGAGAGADEGPGLIERGFNAVTDFFTGGEEETANLQSVRENFAEEQKKGEIPAGWRLTGEQASNGNWIAVDGQGNRREYKP